jgi:hypothetical protein
MSTRKLLTRFMLVIAAGLLAAAPALVASSDVDGAAAFARLKMLEGRWEAKAANGQVSTTTFELVAGGTVLLERYANPALPGGGHMVTAYHLDGRSLILTHYCIARNQPTLRADRFDAATGTIQFEFLRGSNMPTEEAGHMRRALYRIDDADHFTTEWEFFEKGVKKMVETAKFARVK